MCMSMYMYAFCLSLPCSAISDPVLFLLFFFPLKARSVAHEKEAKRTHSFKFRPRVRIEQPRPKMELTVRHAPPALLSEWYRFELDVVVHEEVIFYFRDITSFVCTHMPMAYVWHIAI